ncbi:MAG: [protein-PII] uridylyltransferase [Hirschia sp.]|nr:[protein-PII] uridylyltransferase [Hirschia sp.]MBF18834.1 [protein-PII] uridylyltransferase [Hirschia sp.]
MIAQPDTYAKTRIKPKKWRIADIVDGRNLRVQLTAAHMDNASNEMMARARVLDLLHGAMFRGRMIAQERLEMGADGLDTARLLSAVMDEVLSALYDYTITHVFRSRNLTEGERMAVLAVGGYGRSALAPSSDVDLLFVRTYKQTPWAESVIEYMLYMLWDLGLKVGHSFRTIDECIRLSKEDVTIQTAMLDRRFLFGDEQIADKLTERYNREIVEGGGAAFVAAKLEERDRRIAKQGGSRYRVEPNIKDGKGGLRDLQTLFWLARFLHGGANFDKVLANAAFTRREAAVFRREARFLWTVRCHLHFLAGRPEERLSFDLQPEMAARLDFVDKGGMSAVERFMKRYFLAAKEVGALTRLLCARLEAQEQKRPSGLLRFLPTPAPKPLKDDRFILEAGRVSVTTTDIFEDDPKNMFRLFIEADKAGLDVHPEAMRAVRDYSRRITKTFRADNEAKELFLELATSPDHPGTTLKLMNETGLLGRFLPEFGRIVCQTQFNMYHHFTVDEHTLRAVDIMNEIERGRKAEDHPLSTEIFPKIRNRRALYLAMLLHDTGKGQGDQQIEGERTAREACLRLGLPKDEAELVAWLVGHHLEMSDTAQRRDISEPVTIVEFAKLVGSVEKLRLLLVLTVCDICAVGPGVWNAWKGQLLRELYYAAEAALSSGGAVEQAVRDQMRARAEDSRAALRKSIGEVPRELDVLEDAYWNTFDAEYLAWHARTVGGVGNGVAAGARVDIGRGITEVVLYGSDRPALFANLCGVLTAAGANIQVVRLFAGEGGAIMDVFDVMDASGAPFCEKEPSRLQVLTDALNAAARGELAADQINTPPLQATRRQAAFIIKPEVHIDRQSATEAIMIELMGRDRPGLMHDIAVCLLKHDLSIQSAHAESDSMLIHDVFYVLASEVEALDEAAIKADLLAVLKREEPDAPRTPIGALAQAVASDDR